MKNHNSPKLKYSYGTAPQIDSKLFSFTLISMNPSLNMKLFKLLSVDK